MTTRASVTAPRTYARVAGVLYLIIIVLALFGAMFVRSSLIVWGDPTATAEKITSSELLWRVHIACDLFYLVCAVAMALVFYVLLRPVQYVLLRPVQSDLALLATFFNLVSITLEAAPPDDAGSLGEVGVPELFRPGAAQPLGLLCHQVARTRL